MSLGQNFDGVHDFPSSLNFFKSFFFLKRLIIWPLKPVGVYVALKEGWEHVLHTNFQDLLLGGNFFCYGALSSGQVFSGVEEGACEQACVQCGGGMRNRSTCRQLTVYSEVSESKQEGKKIQSIGNTILGLLY